MSGYTGLAREKVAACSEPVHEPNVGGKRKRGEQVAPLSMRKAFWKRNGVQSYAALASIGPESARITRHVCCNRT